MAYLGVKHSNMIQHLIPIHLCRPDIICIMFVACLDGSSKLH